MTVLQIFHALGVPTDKFTCVNILEDDSLRSGLKEFSQVCCRASFALAFMLAGTQQHDRLHCR